MFPAVGLGRGLLLGCPLTAAGKSFTVDCIHVGNPHCVVSCETLPTAAQLAVWGAAIEKHPAFPAGVFAGVRLGARQRCNAGLRYRRVCRSGGHGAAWSVQAGNTHSGAAARRHPDGWRWGG